MRTKIFYGLLVAAFMTIQSCDSNCRLAKNVEGSWQTAPEAIDIPMASSAVGTACYTFTRDADTKDGGKVALNIDMKVSKPVNPTVSDSIGAFQATASGVAVMEGTWKAVDDDELFIMFDPKSLTVTIDPSTVELTPEFAGDAAAPALETFKAGVAELLKQEMQTSVERKYLTTHHFDDVKVKDNCLYWEVGEQHFTLTRK